MERMKGEIIAKSCENKTSNRRQSYQVNYEIAYCSLERYHTHDQALLLPSTLQVRPIVAQWHIIPVLDPSKASRIFTGPGEAISASGAESDDLKDLISLHQARECQTCVSHGDLSPLNTLVHEGRTVGIVDWEIAGRLPDSREYTSAYFVSPYWQSWQGDVGRFLYRYDAEVDMEGPRRKYFGHEWGIKGSSPCDPEDCMWQPLWYPQTPCRRSDAP